MPKVIVIGAGIAGLGAAYALQKQGVEVSVLEAKNEVGGRMRSRKWRGAWIDLGAEYLASSERGLMDLVAELGLHRCMHHYPGGEVAFEVWRKNRGHFVSINRPGTLFYSGALNFMSKLRLAGLLPSFFRQFLRTRAMSIEAYDPSKYTWADNESVESWLSRINPQFLDYLVEPLFEYMYSFRPHEISKGWFLNLFSVHKAPSVHTFNEGLGLVTRTLSEKLDVCTGARVLRVVAGKKPVIIEWEQGGRKCRDSVDAAIVAVPGTRVNGIVEGLDSERSRFFEAVRYSPQEIPYFMLSPGVRELPMMRFYSRKENPDLNTIIYSPFPAKPDAKVFRVKMKTHYILRHLERSDDEQLNAIQVAAAEYFPEAVAAIEDRFLYRWREGLAVFYPGYARSLEKFLRLPPLKGVAFAGDYLTSSNTGAAYLSGQRAAADILKFLS